ncbi:MAG: hypothetical protein H7039_13280, partial [Bryobacteraceae bacterium]|nr:hypothetical protein [Bryobacteraceae bacterium]
FFRTEETHARSLAVDAQDNLIVGTEPGGLILRVSAAGDGFVLYQAAKREVTSVSVAADGSVYAAASGVRTGASPAPGILLPAPAPPPATASAAPQPRPSPVTITPAPSPFPFNQPAISGGSDVYRISKDGYPQRVWTNATDVVYAIAFDSEARAILGTGNKGNIYRIDSELLSTLLVNADPTQITALATGPGDRLYAATGNVGKVYAIGPAMAASGTYESEALDAGSFAQWGRAFAKADLHGGQTRLETRSGNLDRAQKNWSGWAPLDASGRSTSPAARFLQYRTTLTGTGAKTTPQVRQIEIAYKSRNVAPLISEIEITPANYRFNPPSTLTVTPSTTLNLPPLGTKRPATSPLIIDTTTSGNMNYAKGYTGARWGITDPNGDETTSKVEMRGVGETEWKLLRDKIREKYFSFDSASYPDGDYLLRITASDAPDNPADQALSRSLDSDRFTIDNTPPAISNLTGVRSGSTLTLKWQARDERSLISKAEYSVNGAEWTVVDSRSGLSDAQQLEYQLSLESPGATESTIAVRVTDEYDNQSVAKAVVR